MSLTYLPCLLPSVVSAGLQAHTSHCPPAHVTVPDKSLKNDESTNNRIFWLKGTGLGHSTSFKYYETIEPTGLQMSTVSVSMHTEPLMHFDNQMQHTCLFLQNMYVNHT